MTHCWGDERGTLPNSDAASRLEIVGSSARQTQLTIASSSGMEFAQRTTAAIPAPQSGAIVDETKHALSISADDMEKVLDKVTTHIQAISPQDDLHALVTDFRSFIQRGNIVDLAIGMIMGTSFTAILQSLVVDILSPILSLVSTRSLGNYYAVARCPHNHKDCSSDSWETPSQARDSGAITVNYGLFIENVVRFFINALFLYFAVKRAMMIVQGLNKLMKSADLVAKGLKVAPTETKLGPSVQTTST